MPLLYRLSDMNKIISLQIFHKVRKNSPNWRTALDFRLAVWYYTDIISQGRGTAQSRALFALCCGAEGNERMGIKMEKFTEMINALDSWLWGLPMIVLLLSGVIAKETRHYLANLDEKDTTEIPVVRR